MRHPRHPRFAASQRGAAALIVVMLLFFVLSLVAAYTSRNLIFEQKASANQYRATQALEAAEAGVEWALAMLNGGRIDASCAASTNSADNDFRDRYLIIDDPDLLAHGAPQGSYKAASWMDGGAEKPLYAACVADGAGGWSCSCPTTGNPVLSAPAGVGQFPAFRVSLKTVGSPGPPATYQSGVLRIESTGCTRLDDTCLGFAQGASGDAAARINVIAALAGALPTPPGAALTVRGVLDTASAITLSNRDPSSNGVTVNAGGTVTMPSAVLQTLPGSPSSLSIVANDPSMPATGDELFVSIFRSDKARFEYQPAAVRLGACATGCATQLDQAWRANPGRVLWVDGDMNIETAQTLGSATDPVMIVATGNVQFADGVVVNGLVYSQGDDWTNTGNATINGALVVEGDFHDASSSVITYDPAILNRLKLATGSLVRVPGSWRDF